MKHFFCLTACTALLWSSEVMAGTSLATGSAQEVPWFRIILSFLLCIVLAVAAIYVLRAYHGRGGGSLNALLSTKEKRDTRRLDIVEMRRINTHADLFVVHFGGEEILLSVARDGATILARHDRTETAVDASVDHAFEGPKA